ncbi:MAG: hypothetical protein NC307_05380 [Roseburia sp.]|nr:hypothetical protein [Roseburia sp.]
MIKDKYRIFLCVCCLCFTSGCGSKPAENQVIASSKTEAAESSEKEILLAEQETLEVTAESETTSLPEETKQQEATEDFVEILDVPEEENGLLELYADGKAISIPPDVIMAFVSSEELLKGNLALYDRFRIDGWVFEWMMSDYNQSSNNRLTDGVLVISREGNAQEVQIVHGLDVSDRLSVEDKFEYTDVNFDGGPDLLLCTGGHGNQGLIRYQCLLQTEEGFAEEESFEEIANPAVDIENKVILSQWRNNAVSHSWAEYVYQDGNFVLSRELKEDVADETDFDSDEYIWVWTVNGEEIARSDKLSDEEIENLIFNENSDWGISCDRWRTLYNQGLTTDYSIYGGP